MNASIRQNSLWTKPQKYLHKLLPLICLLTITMLFWKWLGDIGISYDWHWNRIWRYFGKTGENGFTAGPLLKGIWLTVSITLTGLICACCSGLLAATLRLSPWGACIWLARFYVVLWRSTPLLLQLFVAYFLVSPVLELSPFLTATLCLGLFGGAYFAEVFRSGILSVHKNQWEAGLSLGFSIGQTFAIIILPQAMRNVLPSLSNQAIAVLKDSSLVSAIAVADLTMQSQAIVAETFLAFEVWLLAGAIYLALALVISLPALWLERKNLLRGNQ